MWAWDSHFLVLAFVAGLPSTFTSYRPHQGRGFSYAAAVTRRKKMVSGEAQLERDDAMPSDDALYLMTGTLAR